MDDIDKLKALLNSASHQVGTEFSRTCIKLLEEIIISVQEKERANLNLEKPSKAAETTFTVEKLS